MSSSSFGSSRYASAFQNLPSPDVGALRQSTLDYLDEFDPQTWYDHPITSLLNGDKLPWDSSKLTETKDAFGTTNGLQQLAWKEQVDLLEEHIRNYRSPYKDLRGSMRRIEAKLLSSEYSGFLIGNQSLDFGKQDGITEVEEATMANQVERVLNDNLIEEEKEGKVSISRKIIYVSCVSNFTVFLDLFRKTLRSLELGIPCVILSRSNTSQHAYRWTELLMNLMKDEGIADLGMLSFLSCSLDDIKKITQNNKHVTGNLYATCSRELAADMVSGYPNTVASTQGPNTLVTTEFTEGVQEAIRMSATIESSGQCTALRHCVVPRNLDNNQLGKVFELTRTIPDALHALKNSLFDGVFAGHKGRQHPEHPEYQHLNKSDAYFKASNSLPDDSIEEYWRKVVVDFSQLDDGWEKDDATLFQLASWLNRHQPISLAINANRKEALKLGMKLFEKTGLVVYTVGSTDDAEMPPALTCQARPQEAEIFGEFPPRDTLNKYTRYPVYVPSSTPSYDSTYTKEYLEKQQNQVSNEAPASIRALIASIHDPCTRGFCVELFNYIEDATKENPKRGFGDSRTALWGLQRPPHRLGLKTLIRCSNKTTLDAVAPLFLLFFGTTARNQVEVSIHPDNAKLLAACRHQRVAVLVQTDSQFREHSHDKTNIYNLVHMSSRDPMTEFPLAGQFVSLYVPLGHIKSTKSNDEEFVDIYSKSEKWLKLVQD